MSQHSPDQFRAFVVETPSQATPAGSVRQVELDDLPPGDVVIEVEYSSLNYKDALACMGHPGIVKKFPHVPGIDAAGRVVENTGTWPAVGDRVLVTGYGQGAEVWGGFSERIRVPAEWVVPLPEGVEPREAMLLGTAGFTAAQSVSALAAHGVSPEKGEVIVTGATGGVGLWSVALLGHLGYRVTAVTGKPHCHDLLKELGAAAVVGRDAVTDSSDRPLLAGRWAGAIDTVGGEILATLVRSTAYRGCVTACGLVAGDKLPLSVYPFLLRGVTLAGIDSAKCPREPRLEIWEKLFGPWRVSLPGVAVTEITLEEVPLRVAKMLEGDVVGRTIVRPASAPRA